MKAASLVLGIAASHNGGACLLRGNEIVAAIQEERLTRRKRQRVSASHSCLSIEYCLRAGGVTASDLDMVVICTQAPRALSEHDLSLNPQLAGCLGRIPVLWIPHHLGHAVGAFATSPFDKAAVLVVDGMGSPVEDWLEPELPVAVQATGQCCETASLYLLENSKVTPLEKLVVNGGRWLGAESGGMPTFGSLGGMYSAVAHQIFGSTVDAGKVMGLAGFGRTEYPVDWFLEFDGAAINFQDRVPALFRDDRRWPKESGRYANLAASTQRALEEGVLHLAHRARRISGSAKLAYAGGVALNSIANERIIREAGFREVHIMPAAEDNGTAIGAAFYGLWQLRGTHGSKYLSTDSVGQVYEREIIERAIDSSPGLRRIAHEDLIDEVVERLIDGQVCGWFQGRSEFGPRALGSRSILCDARNSKAKDFLNETIKFREGFRPFAPVILSEFVDEWFDTGGFSGESPFMLRVLPIRPEKRSTIPSVVHVDGTGRVQTLDARNGRLYRLVKRFYERTGTPVLLNTSFNVADEPIVESPLDAIWCFLESSLDFCVLEDKIICKSSNWRSILDLRPRIVARLLTNEPMTSCHFDRTSSRRVDLRVDMECGQIVQSIEERFLALLEHVDGVRDGWDVCRKHLGHVPKERDVFWVERELSILRRAGIIIFD